MEDEAFYQAVAVVLGSVALATVIRGVRRSDPEWGTWRRWFEVATFLTLFGLVGWMVVGFVTAPSPYVAVL